MTKTITIQPITICNKSYNTLVIDSINTVIEPTSSVTNILFSIVQSGNNTPTFNGLGYKEKVTITNSTAMDYTSLINELVSMIGVTIVS